MQDDISSPHGTAGVGCPSIREIADLLGAAASPSMGRGAPNRAHRGPRPRGTADTSTGGGESTDLETLDRGAPPQEFLHRDGHLDRELDVAIRPYLLHWLESCPSCRQRLATLRSWAEEVAYSDLSVVARERPLAHHLWSQIENVPTGRLKATLGGDHYFWAMVSLLLQKSRQALCLEPERAVALAESAATIATILPQNRYDRRQQADLRGRTWIAVGIARRVAGRGADAEQAALKGMEYLRAGSRNPLDRARGTHLLGDLHKDHRRFGEAAEAYQRAETLYRRAGREELASGVYLNLAALAELSGDTDGAIAHLTHAQGLIDPLRERALYASCQQKLLFYLIRAGHYAEAELRIPLIRRIWSELGHLENLTLVLWNQGQMHQGQGDLEAALETYRDVSRRFRHQRVDYWAAVAELDIASVHAASGDLEQATAVAFDAVDTLEKIEVGREARAALAHLRAAAETRRISATVARTVADFLRHLRLDQRAKFVPAAS